MTWCIETILKNNGRTYEGLRQEKQQASRNTAK